MPPTADLQALTAAEFEARLKDKFVLKTAAAELTLELAEVRRLGQAKRAGGAFALLLVSPPGPFLPQAIYPLSHADLGTLELFLVPIGPAHGGNGYEAVFT